LVIDAWQESRAPGFPVKIVGVDQLHPAFFAESRMRCRLLLTPGRKSGPHQKKSGLSPTHFSVFLRSADGEARGQIRLLLKNTPISDQIQ
jgi:hypothetical protein